jgi:DNA repair protein RecN (Recombination protein N)
LRDELIVKRTFSLGGNSRHFVNGSPTTLALLKAIGDELVDLHGPHDHQSLLVPDRQLALLDSFARAEGALRDYQGSFRRLQSLVSEEQALSSAEAVREQELDLLRHQVQEIATAKLEPLDVICVSGARSGPASANEGGFGSEREGKKRRGGGGGGGGGGWV